MLSLEITFSVLQGDTLHIKAQSVPSYLMCRNTSVDILVLRDKKFKFLNVKFIKNNINLDRQTNTSYRLGDHFEILATVFIPY